MRKTALGRALVAWLPVVVWMGVIFLASTDLGSASHTSLVVEPLVRWINPNATSEQVDLVHFLVRKTAHLTEYAILGALFFRALRLSSEKFRRNVFKASLLSVSLSAVYASSDEFHQSFVSDRTACVQDVLIDSTGALLCVIAIAAWIWWHDSKKSASGAVA